MANRLLLLVFATLWFSTVVAADTVLHFSSPDIIQQDNGQASSPSPIQRISLDILQQLYGRLNHEIRLDLLPAERSLKEANLGHTDGELHRIKAIEASVPDLIRLPVAINRIDFVAFARKGTDIRIDGWDSLRPYQIGYQRGIKAVEQGLSNHRNALASNDSRQLLRMLSLGRLDLVVVGELGGLELIKKYGFNNIVPLSPPVQHIELYHYLHRKHQSLIPELRRVLAEMHRDGSMDKIRSKHIKGLMAR